MNKKINKTKKKKYNIVVYLLVLVLLYMVIFIIPKVGNLLKSSYVAEYGQLDVSDQVSGYMIRNEKVYFSDSQGEVNRFIKDGNVARGDTTIVQMTLIPPKKDEDVPVDSEGQDLIEQLGKKAIVTDKFKPSKMGFVSYYVDGYEKELAPKNISQLTRFYLRNVSQENVKKIKSGKIDKNAPVFRYISRKDWHLVTFVPEEHLKRYTKGKEILIKFPGSKKNLVVAYVDFTEPDGKVVLKSDNYFPELSSFRAGDVTLLSTRARGLILEEKSITKRKGQTGVYILDKQGKPNFVPVMILGQDKGKVVIANSYFSDKDGKRIESVQPYADVLKNPGRKR